MVPSDAPPSVPRGTPSLVVAQGRRESAGIGSQEHIPNRPVSTRTGGPRVTRVTTRATRHPFNILPRLPRLDPKDQRETGHLLREAAVRAVRAHTCTTGPPDRAGSNSPGLPRSFPSSRFAVNEHRPTPIAPPGVSDRSDRAASADRSAPRLPRHDLWREVSLLERTCLLGEPREAMSVGARHEPTQREPRPLAGRRRSPPGRDA